MLHSVNRRVSSLVLVVSSVLSCVHAADFKIGPDNIVDSLALCAGKDSYLAVWRDITVLPATWRACTVSQTGVSGTDFAINSPDGRPLESAVQINSVVFDGTNFLTVWADNRAAAPGVYARRIAPDGTFVTPEVLVSPVARNSDIQPQVAFSGIDFVVAWQDNANTSTPNATQIRYARLGFFAATPGTVDSIALATASSSQKLFAVTTGPTGEVLITFQDTGVTPTTTRAIRTVSPGSLLTPAEGLAISEAGFGQLGFGSPLGSFYINNEYQLLTSFGTRMDSSVFRIRVLADNRIIRSTNPLGDVPQGDTTLDETNFPRTFYNGAGEFFFVRNVFASSSTTHITSKRVLLDGEDRDPNLLVLDSASAGLLNGGVAANIGTQYLVAWMDGRRAQAPARQTNVYGAFIDGAAEADEGFGAVKAVARAAPVIGIAPLTTSFGAGGSTGTIDSSVWDFGDGTTADTITSSHKYENAGDYIAILTLFRRGLASRDFVRIFVSSETKGGGGGPAQSVTGAPIQSSPGVNPDLFFSSFSALLNFTKPQTDSLRLFGYISPAQIPFSQTDIPVSATIGNRTFTFTLDDFGNFASKNGDKPFIRFQLNRFTGTFQVTTVLDSLSDVLGPFGATNTTIAKPGQAILLPVSLSFNDLSRTETLNALYTANVNKTGTVNYRLGSSGFPSLGYFRILNVAAKERGKIDFRAHQFGLNGTMGFGGGQPFTKAATGAWRITLGNYTEAIPVGSIKLEKNGYSYNAPKGTKGAILVLNYFFSSGSFQLLWNDLPAEGDNPSGMPVSTSTALSTDLVLNMDLDLEGGTFQSGAYARFTRKKSNTKKWSAR